MTSQAIDHMLREGLAQHVDGEGLPAFLAGDGLRVLLFSGIGAGRSEGHDVAVAVREILRAYGASLRVGVVDAGSERALLARFRVAVLPSLVFVSDGQILEVLPRVRDWTDYAGAFRRYLGDPPRAGTAPIAATGEPA